MTASVIISDLSIEFTKYTSGIPSLKEDFINYLTKKNYQRKDKLEAISDLDLSVVDGQRLGVIGRNGAGKSTLMKAIAGIYAPSKGEISVTGTLLPLLELGAGFDPFMQVKQNIYLNGAILGMSHDDVAEIEKEILEFAELTEFSNQPLRSLSSGMRSRLSFSIATYISPDILLLDEVFAAGDAAFVKKAKAKMLELIESSKIMLFTSHRQSQIMEVCDSAIVLHKGKLVYAGDTADAYKYYNNEVLS